MLNNLIFHHIGYAVSDIHVTSEFYIKAGWTLSEIFIDKVQNSQIAFLSKLNFPLMELVAPINEYSPVIKTLDKIGVTPYHICYEIEDIEQAVIDLKKQRFLLLFKPVPASAFGNRKICYLYNQHTGLIELLSIR
ncbi:lactoylglutathione lyase [Spirochaetia bacterium]|nr:lactoylglutathione lyase [Spirochaetia bacterium]